MAKSLLILMLVATQLLAGSGVSVQLCVSGDGSFCCLDCGSDTCGCCREPEMPTSDCRESQGGENADAVPADHGCDAGCCVQHVSESPEEAVLPGDLGDAVCGCTHVPLILSTDEQAIAIRLDTLDGDGGIDLHADRLPASFALNWSVVRSPPLQLQRSRQLQIPSYALAVIATAVIRC